MGSILPVGIPPLDPLWLSPIWVLSAVALCMLSLWIALGLAYWVKAGDLKNRGGAVLSIIGIVILTPLIALPTPSTVFSPEGSGYEWLVLGSSVLRLTLVMFIAGTVFRIYRRGKRDSIPQCLLGTAYQSTLLLGKVLLVTFFAIQLGQLPFRAVVTHRLRAQMANEVQEIMKHSQPAGVNGR